MSFGRDVELHDTQAVPVKGPATVRAAGWYRLVSGVFAGAATTEAVATRVHVPATPEAVWHCLVFYEEVSGRPPFLLRTLLPRPVRTEGAKTAVGSLVRCTYHGGELVKRITAVEPLRLLQFEVVEQRLGIEGCVETRGGAYLLSPCDDGTDVVLVTEYRAYLRPRALWRRLESLLVGELHGHVLEGLGFSGAPDGAAAAATAGRSRALPRAGSECLACKISPSPSRR
jgi:hypothetical protein